MISIRDYFSPRWGHPDATPEKIEAADDMLSKVNALLFEAEQAGVYHWQIDPDTGTNVSGSKNGSGDGGFRPHDATTGAPRSKHKLARAVDVYDPDNRLDRWLTDYVLAKHGLYREAPEATSGWVHLQDVAPGSGTRTFFP